VEEKAVQPFAVKYGLTFPCFWIRIIQTSKVYGTDRVPETFIVDKDGIVVKKLSELQTDEKRVAGLLRPHHG